MIHSYLTSL